MNEQVSVSLGLDISYVYGTVNGVEATFTLTAPGVWSATVPKASDNKYVVVITAYNNLGTSATYNTTIYKLDGLLTLKLDWTKDDYYNAEDLNRVEANTQYLADLLSSFRAPKVILGTVVVDRDNTTIEFYDSLNRLEGNVQSICNNFYTPPNFQGTNTNWRSGQYFDFKEATRLENNLLLLFYLIQNTINAFVYCNQYTCGGSVI